MTDNTVTFAGQVEVNKVELTSVATGKVVDISKIMLEMNIYEDLFSNYITGTITVSDSNDLINYFPLVGEERLDISYKTPGLDDKFGLVENIFYVYKITDRSLIREKTQVYIIHFMSEEGFSDQHVKISKGYRGKYSDIVKDIFNDGDALGSRDEVSKKFKIEETSNAFQMVVPTWSPMKTINWIASRSITKSGVPNYIFYQDSFNYNFCSINSLLAQQPSMKFWNTTLNIRQIQDIYKGEEISQYNIVRSTSNDLVFDVSSRMASGMFSSNMIYCDLLTKSINNQEFDYIDSFSSSKHLNEFPMNSKKIMRYPKSCTVVYVNHQNMWNDFPSDYPETWVLHRRSLMQQIGSYKAEITVPGRSDYKVGMIIELEQNTIRNQTSNEEAEDLMNKGNFLVTSIVHRIAKNEMEDVIEICRDSVISDINNWKV